MNIKTAPAPRYFVGPLEYPNGLHAYPVYDRSRIAAGKRLKAKSWSEAKEDAEQIAAALNYCMEER